LTVDETSYEISDDFVDIRELFRRNNPRFIDLPTERPPFSSSSLLAVLRRPVTLGFSPLPSSSTQYLSSHSASTPRWRPTVVSSEDTQAQLDEFRQMPWIKPDYKVATLDTLRKVERYWRPYSPSALRLQSGVRSDRISFVE